MQNPAVFFDRDGILNRIVMRNTVVGSPRSLAEFSPFADVGTLLSSAARAGTVVVITNQPDAGKGLLARHDLELMHRQLVELAPGKISKILWEESHHPDHPRRKPQPTMLLEAAHELNLDLTRSWMIGDSLKDLQAGERAGTKTVLLQTPYNQPIHGAGTYNFDTRGELLQWLKKLPPCG